MGETIMSINRIKGQISIFIVIGIILVVGFIFLISTSFTDVPIFSDEKNTNNVKEFVESCLLLETKSAISKLGASGGWLYPKPMIYTDRESIKELNKMATGLDFLEKNKMPYWFYYEDSDEVFKTYIPEYNSESEYSMQSQVKKYLDENLEINCFKGFDNFKDIYNIDYDRNELDTKVRFLDKEIVVELNLDLEIENVVNSEVDYISSFKTNTENKLYLPYHMAIEIIKAEINSSFMDTRVIQMLRPYQSSEGRDLLPPQSETKLNYDFDVWYMDDVEKTAKEIISSEISRVQFLNTNYETREIPQELINNEFVRASNEIYLNDYLRENTNLDEENSKLFEQFENLKVTPTFEPFFPIFFRIQQAIGDTILLPSPEMMGGFLPIFYTKYKASYEIAAPIIFEIKSDIENDDFIFNLPIEINIKHNTALKNNYAIVEDSSIGESLPKPKKTLICDPSQYVSEVVSINLIDPISYGNRDSSSPMSGVDDAFVQFTCKEISECHIMQTSLGGDSNIAEDLRDTTTELRFRLPINCNPGKLEITKFGHEKIVFDNLNPKVDEGIDLGTVEMSSGKDLNVSVGLRKSGAGSFSSLKSFQEFDSGFMIFENLDDENIIRVINVDSDNQYNTTINLIPGRYKITGLVIYENEINIPSEEICYSTGLFSGDDCEIIPATNLSSWLRGGYTINEFSVSATELLNFNNLDVSFVEYTLPENYDDLKQASEQMSGLETYSSYPRFNNK
jgi:hypothetical protein